MKTAHALAVIVTPGGGSAASVFRSAPRRLPSAPSHARFACGAPPVEPGEESGRPELDTLDRFVARLQVALGLDGWAITVEIAADVRDDRGRLAWAKVRVINATTARLTVRDAMRPPRGVSPDEAHVLVRLEIARALARLASPKASEKELDTTIAKLMEGSLAKGRAATPRRAPALPSGPYVHARPCGPRTAPGSGSIPSLAGQLVAHYQRALRVQEWRIALEVKPDPRDAEGRPTWARLAADGDSKRAVLTVRDPTRAAGVRSEDAYARLRAGIVRALVRLHFAPFGNRTPKAIAAAVEGFASALLSAPKTTPAKRGATPNPRTPR